VNTQWLVLASALIVLAGLLVAWSLSRAADRVQVVQARRALQSGQVIRSGDLGVVGVAADASVQGLVPASSLDALVGRLASIDVSAGSLLVAGMWQDVPQIVAGEQAVGAVLQAGRFPLGLARGDLALAVPLAADAAGAAEGESVAAVAVRVIEVAGDADELRATLAVPTGDAVRIARLAAVDRLVLVGVPSPRGGG
jgi:hypothetical protein